MAENNDGSITFDTELDNTGFEKGSEKMLQAIKDVTASVDNMGDNMMESFSKMLPLLTNIANSTSLIAERITGAATQAAEANTEIASSEQQVVQAAQAAAEAVGQEQQAATDFSTGALNMKNTTSQLEREVNSLAEKMQSISSSTEAGFSNGKAVLTFDAKLSDIENKLASAREKLAQFGATKIPTEDYQQLSKQIEKTEQSLFKLYDRRDEMKDLGVKSKSKAWQRLALDIKNTETELDRYERQQAAMENNGTAFVQGTNTGTYAQMEQSLNNTEAALARNKALIDAEALAQARLNVQVAQEKVNLAETESERQTALANLQAAQQELNNVASSMSMKGGNMGPGEGAISGWERLARTVSSFGAAAKVAAAKAAQLIAHLSKAAFNTFTKGVKNAINGLKNYASQAKQTILSSNALVKSLTSVKTLLKTRIKRMLLL